MIRETRDSAGLFRNKQYVMETDCSDLLQELTGEELKHLQQALFEIYQDIQQVCNRINVIPFLVGGTALGAVRHGDFIPWDDDLDLGMLREDYDRFLEEFSRTYPDKYIVNAPGFSGNAKARFAKVIKTGTRCCEIIRNRNEELNGVFIDIFPLDHVPKNRLLRRMKGLACDCLCFISGQVYRTDHEDPLSRAFNRKTGTADYTLRTLTGRLFSFSSSSKWYNRLDRCMRSKDTDSGLITSAAGMKHYFGEIIHIDDVLPAREIMFHGASALVFRNVEKYLTMLYGDYMVIPPPEKRWKHFVRELKL